ncbi:Beta-defensin 128 [Manis javanica]|nr:Beta-defensin 128 [Manis javanica]
MGEAYEIACLNGKLCCVKEENNKYLDAQQLPPSPIQSDGEMDYIILSTTTLLTTQP